jgi:hypothetical protein
VHALPAPAADAHAQAVVDHASVYSSYDPQEDYTGEGPGTYRLARL